MPLISSPIDGSPMRQINRYGIEIDVCPTSGGIWLDKGELEKLMVLLKEEARNDDAHFSRENKYPEPRPQAHYRDDDDYDDDYKRGYKKKSKASRIMDIFDF